jgi:hypothetical protein
MKSPRAALRWLKLFGAALVLWLLLPVLCTDFLFRAYERRYLMERLEPTGSGGVIALDELGYNEEPIARRSARGEFRVLSFGDSFAYSLLRPQHTYHRLLGQRLSRRLDRRVSVVNFGEPGTSFPTYLSQLRYWTEQREYDAILVNVYAGNDFADLGTTAFGGLQELDPRVDVVDGQSPQEALLVGPAMRVPHTFPLRILDYLYAFYASLAHAGKRSDPRYRRPAHEFSPDAYLQMQRPIASAYRRPDYRAHQTGYLYLGRFLRALADEEERGKRTAVFVSPPEVIVSERLRQEVARSLGKQVASTDPQLPLALVRGVAARVGYTGPILDLTDCLRRREDPDNPLYLPRNTHWSARGDRVVAELLELMLAAHWFDSAAGERPCPQPSATADPKVEAFLERTFAAEQARAPLWRAFRGRTFDSQPELRGARVAEDLRPTESIRGTLQQLLSQRRFTVLSGWVGAGKAREPTDLQILAFRGGRLFAAGLAYPPPRARGQKRSRQGRFSLRVRASCNEILQQKELWLVAVSPDRRFGWITIPEELDCSGQ